MAEQQVEMPDGNIRNYNAKTVQELKRYVAKIVGVDRDEVAILNEHGQPVPETQAPPQKVQVIPKPKWGASSFWRTFWRRLFGIEEKTRTPANFIDEYQLGQDIMQARYARGYGAKFHIKLISENTLNPFRVYIYFLNDWWPVRVNLSSYPMNANPTVTFEQRIPPCPVHLHSWHPNVYDSRDLCWGNAKLLPGTKIVGLLNALYGLLQTPNHESAVSGRCH